MARMFLNGEGMAGGTAHPHIAGSAFLGARRTAPIYQFLAFGREFPGLLVGATQGTGHVEGELYDVPLHKLANLLLAEPPELELSIVQLDDGEYSFGMVVRAGAFEQGAYRDITAIGSWRKFLAALDNPEVR